MLKNRLAIRLLSFIFCLSGVALPTHAVDRGVSSKGIAFVSGGVGYSELQSLNDERKGYSFWLTTAAKGSGAYLAAVRVRIIDSKTNLPMLDHTMDGPWLFAALPSGRYGIEASYRQAPGQAVQVVQKTATIRAGDRRQMVIYFDSPDTVSDDKDASFNPYKTN
jgi:hypothetical protein